MIISHISTSVREFHLYCATGRNLLQKRCDESAIAAPPRLTGRTTGCVKVNQRV
jgi:hypothetical protein